MHELPLLHGLLCVIVALAGFVVFYRQSRLLLFVPLGWSVAHLTMLTVEPRSLYDLKRLVYWYVVTLVCVAYAQWRGVTELRSEAHVARSTTLRCITLASRRLEGPEKKDQDAQPDNSGAAPSLDWLDELLCRTSGGGFFASCWSDDVLTRVSSAVTCGGIIQLAVVALVLMHALLSALSG